MFDPVFSWAASIFLVAIFLQAGWQKLTMPLHYQTVIENYAILPEAIVPPATFIIGLLELLAALAVFVPATHQVALLLLGSLLLGYMLVMALNIARGRADIDCGCAGPAHQQTISTALLWRNLLLMLITAFACLNEASRDIFWLDLVSIIAGGGSAYLLYHISNLLIANHTQLVKLRAL